MTTDYKTEVEKWIDKTVEEIKAKPVEKIQEAINYYYDAAFRRISWHEDYEGGDECREIAERLEAYLKK